MEQRRYLIDTNAVIDYLACKLPDNAMSFLNRVVDDVPIISVITKMEVLGFNAPQQHYALLVDFMNDALVLDLSTQVVDTTIELRKTYKTKLPDAIIAATALTHKLTLLTRNTKDFLRIQNLQLINPYEL